MAADDEMPTESPVVSPISSPVESAVETVPVDAEVRDALPSDLDVTGFVGPYKFPDNSRRRIPGIIYLVIAALCVLAWLLWNDSGSGLVNGGFLLAAALLAAVGRSGRR